MSQKRILCQAMVATLSAVVGRGASADPPDTRYIFPAGGQAGTSVSCRVGTLNCADACGFRVLCDQVRAPSRIARMPTRTLVGPYHQNPVAQQPWDYPQDMAASVEISRDAVPGMVYWYCTTSEGATSLRPFVVGDLPEVVEHEEKTRQGTPQRVAWPVTINGRVYPRGDLDEYVISASAGDLLSCEAVSHRLGHPLDARLLLFAPDGREVEVADDHFDLDPLLLARIPTDGDYVLRIHDIAFEGGQDFVYRLSLRKGPYVTHLFPAGRQHGKRCTVRAFGLGVAGSKAQTWTVPADTAPRRQGGLSQFTAPGHSPLFPEGWYIGCPFITGDIREIVEPQRNDGGSGATLLSLPAVVNGQILRPNEKDAFVLEARAGDAFECRIDARRLQSRLTPLVSVFNAKGDSVAGQQGDGNLQFSAAEDGPWTVHVGALYGEAHAGPRFIYRLAVRRAVPGFQLVAEQNHVGIEPGGQASLKLKVERAAGMAEPIRVEADSLPAGVTLEDATIEAGKDHAEIMFHAAADAPIGNTERVALFGVSGTRQPTRRSVQAQVGTGSDLPPVDSIAVTVTHPQVFAITTTDIYGSANRGATHVQRHHLRRFDGFESEVKVRLADRQARYLQGVTGPTLVCPSEQSSFDYPVFLPAEMDLNRTARIVVMGVARVRDVSGRQHTVTHTTKHQIVARVCPSLLTLTCSQPYLEVAPGTEGSLPLTVGRTDAIRGAVVLEAEVRPKTPGWAFPTMTLSERTLNAGYAFHVAPDTDLSSPHLYTIRVTATGKRDGYPAVARASAQIRVTPFAAPLEK